MFDVVVLVEQPITQVDARQIADVHADRPEPAHYHVLLPVEDATTRVEATIGSLAASEVLGTSSLYFGEEDLERLQREIVERSREALAASVGALRGAGLEADGEVTAADPLDRLCELVKARDSAEVIVLTRPHLVAELLRVDWTSKARRRLGVPCLRLLAHRDTSKEADKATGDGGSESGGTAVGTGNAEGHVGNTRAADADATGKATLEDDD